MRKTIKTFISNLKPFKIQDNILGPIDNLPYEEKFKKLNEFGYERILYVKENYAYFVINHVFYKRLGKKFFVNRERLSYIYISPTSLKIDCGQGDFEFFLKQIGIIWWKDIPNGVLNRYFRISFIAKSIFIGTIYNEETLYKAIAKRIFHCKEISWRNMKRYCELKPFEYISLLDLKDFTKNINDSIRIYCDSKDKKQIYYDLLNSAVKLGETVDFTWSAKRIEEEHLRQTRKLMEIEIAKKDQTPIYKNLFETPDNIHILNTEREIYREGKNMHHCIYTNYYNSIKNHRYIAFHMNSPQDCTFSVKINDGNVLFDQIYLKYDKSVEPSTRVIALEFIEKHTKDIQKMFEEIIPKEIQNNYTITDELLF